MFATETKAESDPEPAAPGTFLFYNLKQNRRTI